MPADLHIHTNFSDGLLSPEEVVREAKKAGLTVIAISDHDTVDGVEPAIAEAKKIGGIEVIPAVEFSTDVPGTEIHILGYFIDHRSDEFRELLKKIQEDRTNRVHKIVNKLKKVKVDLDLDRVLELAGEGSAGRPHVARALIEAGYVKTIGEAFMKYLGVNGPAYIPHFKLTPVQVIETINKNGGVPVLGHPAVSRKDDMIKDFVSAGLKGIEIYYGKHSDADIKRYLEIAKKFGLLATGGSDFHGEGMMRYVYLGVVKLPDEYVEALKKAAGVKAA
ncbi:PHP domain-containing protein [Candidatus Margulisiibacteriota bacterium]